MRQGKRTIEEATYKSTQESKRSADAVRRLNKRKSRTYQRKGVDDQAVRHRIRLVAKLRRHALIHGNSLLPPFELSEAVDTHIDEDCVPET